MFSCCIRFNLLAYLDDFAVAIARVEYFRYKESFTLSLDEGKVRFDNDRIKACKQDSFNIFIILSRNSSVLAFAFLVLSYLDDFLVVS